MGKFPDELASLPTPVGGAVIGVVVFGAIGMLAGLVEGIYLYPPTAWFGVVLYLGILAGIAGAIVGLIVGTVVSAVAWLRLTAGRRAGQAG